MTTTKKEPRVRKDGSCPTCGRGRPGVAESHHDPFCSSACCREWYGIQLVAGANPRAVKHV
jgi:hypothetical protein